MSIKIRAYPKKGFYRCGRHFTPAVETFPDGTFTAEELEILEAEPMLEVVKAEGEAAPEAADSEESEESGGGPAAPDGQCAHIKDNEERCKNPAVEGSIYCRVHAKEHENAEE